MIRLGELSACGQELLEDHRRRMRELRGDDDAGSDLGKETQCPYCECSRKLYETLARLFAYRSVS